MGLKVASPFSGEIGERLEKSQQVVILRALADQLLSFGNLQLAEAYLAHSLELAQMYAAHMVPSLYADLGAVRYHQGDWARAAKFYKMAWDQRDYCEQINKAAVLIGMANHQSRLGRWKDSISLYESAISLSAPGAARWRAQANVAIIIGARGARLEAIQINESVLSELERYQDALGFNYVLTSMMLLFAELKRNKEYERLLSKVETIEEQQVCAGLEFYVNQTKMIYALRNNDLDGAYSLLTRLKELGASGRCNDWNGWAVIQEAAWLRQSHQADVAINNLDSFLKSSFTDAQMKVEGLFELGLCARAVGNAKLARTVTRRVLSLVARLGFTKEEIRSRKEGLERARSKVPSCVYNEASAFKAYLGNSRRVQEVRRCLDKVASSNATVLLTGESGTGKTMVARLVHDASPRRGRPFVRFDCTCHDEGMLESLLFGHRRGAFTGAIDAREGLVDRASDGTLFIDEIGELPVALQGKLLTLLEDGVYRPLGSADLKRTTVRFIIATNRDLWKEVEGKRFRADLLYRLGNIEVELPPLRKHVEDIPVLVTALLRELANEQSRQKRIEPSTITVLCAYDWPGNVRELRKAVERGCLLAGGGCVTLTDMGLGKKALVREKMQIRTLEDIDRSYICRVLDMVDGNKSQAARSLGLKRTTLYSRMKALGI